MIPEIFTFKVIKRFIDCPVTLNSLIQEIGVMKDRYYTPENIRNKLAYVSDKQPGRESYAFAAMNSATNNSLSLPTIYLDSPEAVNTFSTIQNVSNKVKTLLSTANDPRMLFNFQYYSENSSPVPEHWDGELMDFHRGDQNKLVIKEGLRSKLVAVLTLKNLNPKEGTTLHVFGEDVKIPCSAGDLLVFDNVKCTHSVSSFKFNEKSQNTTGEEVVRITAGWRLLSQNCYEQSGDSVGTIDSDKADYLLFKYLRDRWPEQYREMMKNKDKVEAAF